MPTPPIAAEGIMPIVLRRTRCGTNGLKQRSYIDDRMALPDLTLPAVELAQRLIGCVLASRVGSLGEVRSGVIVETEAYPGGLDRASHTFGGRRTERVKSMWQQGGCAYVYFTYGMHHCMNVVSGPAGSGEAVLLRALEPCGGLAAMAAAREKGASRGRGRGKLARQPVGQLSLRDLCRGPARLCEALGITRELDGVSLLDQAGPLWLEPPRLLRSGESPPHVHRIASGPRIGVDYAGEWAEKKWRFWLRESPWVSTTRARSRPPTKTGH
jgi:DNA-3-methyladenine glycosylase